MVATGVPIPYLPLSTTERHSNWRLPSLQNVTQTDVFLHDRTSLKLTSSSTTERHSNWRLPPRQNVTQTDVFLHDRTSLKLTSSSTTERHSNWRLPPRQNVTQTDVFLNYRTSLKLTSSSTIERHSNWRLRSDATRCDLRFAAGFILCPSYIVRKEVFFCLSIQLMQIGALIGITLSKFDEVCGNQTANYVSVFFHVCSLHKDAFVWFRLSHWHKKSVKWCLMLVTLCQTDRWLFPATIVSRSFTFTHMSTKTMLMTAEVRDYLIFVLCVCSCVYFTIC